MDINIRHTPCGAEIIIEHGGTTIIEDFPWRELDGQVHQFVSSAFELSRANKNSDLETVQSIIENHLNSSEREQLLEWITEQEK